MSTTILRFLFAVIPISAVFVTSGETSSSAADAASFAAMRSQRLRTMARRYPPPTKPAAPLSLTAGDGTGLVIAALSARIVVQGPLARTELHLSFVNPEQRVREGRFAITLPPAATVTRLAMKLPAGWQEAEVVERREAQQVYEDFLHVRQDPALLEKAAGNLFSARVFPIAARSTKQIKIAYLQEVSVARPYRLPLRGLPRIGQLRVSASVKRPGARPRRIQWSRTNTTPTADFEIAAAGRATGLITGSLVALPLTPRLRASAQPIRSMLVLMDTSASRALGFREQVGRLESTLKALRRRHGGQLRLRLVCFDQTTATLFDGPIQEISAGHFDAILARRPLGASNLAGALESLAPGAFDRLLLVTDGVVTAGATNRSLKKALQRLRPSVRRLDVLVVGGIRDEPAMRELTRGALERDAQGALSEDGVVVDSSLPPAELAKRLSLPTVSGVDVAVAGARWSWPRRLDGLQPGDSAVIFAELRPKSDRTAAMVAFSGSLVQKQRVQLTPADASLLGPALSRAKIVDLQQRLHRLDASSALAARLRKRIVALSVGQRVLSELTAMLVLETEADYARYNIRRGARAGSGATPAAKTAQRRGARTAGPDRDADRIIDQDDNCPGEPETYNGYQDDDGCPDRGRVVVHRGRIEIFDKVYFETGRARIKPVSYPILDAVAATLNGNAQITRIELQGHTDQRGSARAKRWLASRRARAVRRYLLGKGVAAARLVARGYADSRPVDRRFNEDAWSRNRRVEFVILRRDGRGRLSWGKTPTVQGPPSLSGRLARIVSFIKRRHVSRALVEALRWHADEPGNVLALIGLGRATRARGHHALAARVFGSIIDLYPSRADLRRFAGAQLASLGRHGMPLAIETYREAVRQRPDHPSSHHQLGLALARAGRHEQAMAALEAGLAQTYRIARPAARRILREDLELVAAAAARARRRRGESSSSIRARLARVGAKLSTRPSVRFLLTWETDANNVDLHVRDRSGARASFSQPRLASGGELYADVTNGYGPECFRIDGRGRAGPYRLSVHYYSRGPMGYGMGAVQVVRHDGRGRLRFTDKPFVVMNDKATVELGAIR